MHLHVLMLNGLYAADRRTGQLRFHRAPRLRTSDVEATVVDVARRCERYLAERRMWEGLEDDQQETLPGLQAASIEGRSAVTGARAKRVQQLGARVEVSEAHGRRSMVGSPWARTWEHGGVSQVATPSWARRRFTSPTAPHTGGPSETQGPGRRR